VHEGQKQEKEMSPQIVKVSLICYGVFACVSIFLLWQNASAPDALKNAGIVVASILPIAISALPYLTLETIEKRLNYMWLFDTDLKWITQGRVPNPYFIAYIPMFANLPENSFSANSFSDLMGEQGLDFVERGVLEGLLSRFHHAWDIVSTSKFKGPGFSSFEFVSGTSSEKTAIPLPRLQTIFKHNKWISQQGIVVMPQLVLPPNSQFEVESNEQGRTIKITNPMLPVKISMSAQMGGVQQQGIWRVQSPDPQNMNRYYAVFFRVSISGELNRTRVHSPEMTLYRRWFENLTEALSMFDWERIDNDIQQTSLREAVSKILGQ